MANLPAEDDCCPGLSAGSRPQSAEAARILVLGGTGFIGKELVRQLIASGRAVRLLVRSAAGIPRGDAGSRRWIARSAIWSNREDLLRAMEGVECVFHLARANVKSWADYQELEIEATRQVAECALEAGVKRLIYTGTIDSYYAAQRAGTITEATPLDRRIERQESLCAGQGGLRRDPDADAPGAGLAAGDCAAGDGDRPRRKPVPLGRGHVVERCGLPDLGRGNQQAGAGAGGGRGRGPDRRHGDAGDRRTVVQSGGRSVPERAGVSGRAGPRGRNADSAPRDADLAVLSAWT